MVSNKMDYNANYERNKPQIECLVTTKMSNVSARVKVILDKMLTQFCSETKLHLFWLKRTDGLSSKRQ